MSHDRATSHTGVELDSVITLSATLPLLDADDLAEALAEIDSRLAQIEGEPRFSLDAVIT